MDGADAIRAFVKPWTQACLDRDWDGLLAMCSERVVFSPPGEPQISGAAVRAWLEAFPVIKRFDWNFESIEVSGDLAVGLGWGRMTVEAEGQEATMNIKFADVFTRGGDGTWRFDHVIWNENEPAG